MTEKFDGNPDENAEELSFEELFASYDDNLGRELKPGDMVEGKIISVGRTSVYVDTGTKSDGVVEKNELLDENGEFTWQAGEIGRAHV